MPSFDLNQSHTGTTFDLIVGHDGDPKALVLYGITSRGKDYIAYLQEVDDVLALGNWTCRILRRDFEAYGFDLARGRGLRLGSYLHQDDAVLVQELNQIPD
jgi:hypothetical protein